MLVLLCAGATAATTRDEAIAEFYTGRTMTMISGYTPDGGDRQQEQAFSGMTITSGLQPRGPEDLHGRLLARHIGRHIAGQPRFVVRTLPGAGGRRAADYLEHHAPRDGSVIGNIRQGLAVERLLQASDGEPLGAASTLQWLGSLRSETGFVIAWMADQPRTAQSLFTRDMIVGGTAPGDDSVVLARALNALIGSRFKIISGYRGELDLRIALERREIDGFVAGSGEIKSRLVPWTQTGQAKALLQLGLQADADFADVPMALDFARNDEDRAALRLLFARQALGAPYAAPPEVPPERIAALRHAFDATMADADFRADALRLEISLRPISGETLHAMLAEFAAVPPALRNRLAAAISANAPDVSRD